MHPMHPMHPMQPYINLYIILIQVYASYASYAAVYKLVYFSYTGCPNKHGNSVTNSISSFQIILRFSIEIPTEKAVICKSLVCYVHILFVYVLTVYGCT